MEELYIVEMIDRYELAEVEARGNESNAWIGNVGDVRIRMAYFMGIARFPSTTFYTIGVAFGEVRHIFNNHTPMAEYGMGYAHSEYLEPGKKVIGGGFLPGNDIEGHKWRVGAVAPKSRTRVVEVIDQFIEKRDIIEYLISLRPQVEKAKVETGDLTFGFWEVARTGW